MAYTVGDAAWFSTTGRDLMTQMPQRCELQLDPGSPYSITFENNHGSIEGSGHYGGRDADDGFR
jgi:hypothetical protein